MKVIDITRNFERDEIKTVICKSDGDVHYCNPLSVNGTCIVRNYICSLAVAVIVQKNGYTQYLAIEH